eukprot:Amastigsp_a686574_6.p1 type:complete len:318 gc:universal Amastigsp_a686574_6:1014-61(-)
MPSPSSLVAVGQLAKHQRRHRSTLVARRHKREENGVADGVGEHQLSEVRNQMHRHRHRDRADVRRQALGHDLGHLVRAQQPRHRKVVRARHRRVHKPRIDVRHRDSVACNPDPQPLRKRTHRGLACAVRRVLRRPAKASDRRHDRDLPRAPRPHRVQQRKHRVEHAVEVHAREHARRGLERRSAGADPRRHLRDPRVGDQQIHGMLSIKASEDLAHTPLVLNVHRHRNDNSALGTAARRNAVEARERARSEAKHNASPCVVLGKRRPDALRGARDHDTPRRSLRRRPPQEHIHHARNNHKRNAEQKHNRRENKLSAS